MKMRSQAGRGRIGGDRGKCWGVLKLAVFSRLLLSSLFVLWRCLASPYDTSTSLNPPCLGSTQGNSASMRPKIPLLCGCETLCSHCFMSSTVVGSSRFRRAGNVDAGVKCSKKENVNANSEAHSVFFMRLRSVRERWAVAYNIYCWIDLKF